MKNTEKNQIYKYLIGRAILAIKYNFDIQAIANCYAIFEDRLEAILKYSKVSLNDENYTSIGGKIKIIRSNVSKIKLNPYIDDQLIKLLENWIKEIVAQKNENKYTKFQKY